MRIAICLSGHFRENWVVAANSLKNHILSPLKNEHIDIFITTYNYIDTKESSFRIDNQPYKNDPRLDVNYVISIYNPLSLRIFDYNLLRLRFDYRRFIPQATIKSNDTVFRHSIINNTCVPIMQSYLWFINNNLRSEQSFIDTKKYDIVIQCRPDLIYKLENIQSILKNIQANTLYVKEIYQQTHKYTKNLYDYALSDVFLLGSYSTLHKVTKLFLDYTQPLKFYTEEDELQFPYEENHSNLLQYGLEQTLLRLCVKNEINYQTVPVTWTRK